MTDIPLIITKFNIPTSQHMLVPRPHLFERLTRGLGSKLILICAPAGSGKSTLIGSWLAQQEACTAWISLDENDNDWIRFFLYMITAFEKTEAGIGTSTLDLINSEKPLSYDELMANVINDLSKAKRDCILALDDFHLIKSRQINSALSFLIDNLPPRIHLVILTRTEPNLPVAKFRSQRRLTELQAIDMQFSLVESEAFLRKVMKLNLTTENITALAKRTEGWVVGLQLAALSIGDRSNPAEFIHNLTGKNKYIADYLIDEVLSLQADDIQSFLLQTSILERMCAELCNSVLEIENSQPTLETLERLNLFIIPLDNSREWYRYHHLFAQLLRSRMERQRPNNLNALYRRACDWYRQHGLLEEAVGYALKGKDYVQASEIVEQIGHPTYWANHSNTLRKWLEALPENILEKSFDLQILHAYVQINIGKVQAAEQTLENLKVRLDRLSISSENERSILQGKLSSAFTSIRYHRRMDWDDTHQLAGQALHLLPHRYIYERCVAYFHGGGALIMSGDLQQAEQYLRCAVDLSASVKNPFAKLLTLSNLGTLYMTRGELHQAMDHFREAHEFGKQCGPSQEATYSSAVVGIATLFYEWDQLEKAREYLEEAIGITEIYDFFDRILITHEAIIQLHCGLTDFAAAEKTLKRTQKIVADNGPTPAVIRRIESLSSYIDCRKGAIDKAGDWADNFAKAFGDKISCELEPDLLIFARIRIAAGTYETAIALLQRLLSLARRQNRLKSVIRIMVLLSVAHFKMGETEKGLTNLKISLTLAEPEDYIRTFVDEGETIRTQLSRLIDTGDIPARREDSTVYIQKLLNGFSKGASGSTVKKSPRQNGSAILYLTPRECDVVVLLDRGLTYAEISDQLQISENTLKFHVKNIYSKLQVNNRVKAVSKAKKLGFI